MGATAITSARVDFRMFGLRTPALARLCLAMALLALSVPLAGALPIPLALPQRAPSAPPVAVPQTQVAPPGLSTALRAQLPLPDPGPPDYTIAPIPDVPDTFAALNAAQGYSVFFTPDGARLTAKAFGRMGLRLVAIGDAGASFPVAAVPPVVDGTRVEYRHGTVTEWYENRAEGIEQGFTLAAPPTADTADGLVLGIALNARTGWQVTDDTLTLRLPGGGGLRYGDLRASDATGRNLPAHLTLTDATIRIAVDTRDAVYPVVIDPTIAEVPTQKVFQGAGINNGDFYGSGLAITNTGNTFTAAIGAPYHKVGSTTGAGEIYITRSTDGGVTWSAPQVFDPVTPNPGMLFGSVLEFSNDMLFIGAPGATVNAKSGAGAIFTYTYNPATGVFVVGQTITAPTPTQFDSFGDTLDVTSNDAFFLAGSPQANNATGKADLFKGQGGSFVPAFPFTAPDGAPGDEFGFSVALSRDGATALVGAPLKVQNGKHIGKAYGFGTVGNTAGTPMTFFPFPFPGDDIFFAWVLAANQDASVVKISAPQDDAGKGDVYEFGWPAKTAAPTQLVKIANPNPSGTGEMGFGMTSSFDADGNFKIVFAGAPSFAPGVVFPITYGGTTPVVESAITSPDPAAKSFGLKVAATNVDAAGKFGLLVGAPDVTGATSGKAFIFTGTAPLGGVGSAGASVLTNLPTPVRVVDTRKGAMGACTQPGQPITGGTTATFTFTSACTGIPTTVTGIVGNVTGVNGVAPGFITLFASGPLPPTSNVNFIAGVPVPNSVIVLVAPDGTIKVYVSVTVDVIIDVTAFLTAPKKPIITGTSPPKGASTGGTPLTIAGSNFQAGATVAIGGQAAGTVVVNPPPAGSNIGSITCTTPAGAAGAADVTVTNPDGSSVTLKGGFTYTVGPSSVGAASVVRAAANTGLLFHPLPKPVRLFDSRPGATACLHPSAALVGGTPINLAAVSACTGVPASAQTILGNGTVVAPGTTGPGFVAFYPGGVSTPTVSNLNYVPGQTVPNAFTVGLDSGGTFNAFGSTGTDLIIDVTGYYDTVTAGGLFLHFLATPVRLLDTRSAQAACNSPAKPVGVAATVNQVATTACATVPAAATAVVGNGTVVADVAGSGPGFVTIFPGGGATLPLASNLNYTAGQVVPNSFTVALGGDGSFNSYALTSIDLILDLSGYYAAT